MSQFLKKTINTKAKSVDEAVENAILQLGVSRDEVDIKVIDEGSKGFLGLGSRDAEIEVSLKDVSTSVAKKFLNDIFNAMNIDVNVDAKKTEDNSVAIDLAGDNMGIVIGKRGDTLDSLQYLTSLVVNQESEDYIKVSIDTENYREKRMEALLSLSDRLAEKVAKTGRKFTLEPMNPYERRIIHSNLQDNEEVTTYSIGDEPYRKVVIAAKNAKPYYKKGGARKNGKGSHKDYQKRENTNPSPAVKDDNNKIENVKKEQSAPVKKTGYKPMTYKADFKPQQHKAEYKSFEEYLAGQQQSNEE